MKNIINKLAIITLPYTTQTMIYEIFLNKHLEDNYKFTICTRGIRIYITDCYSLDH